MGFYQTTQKYINSSVGNSIPAYHVSNNIFIEILPAYIYKYTRVVAGVNVTRSSPTLMTSTSLSQEFGALQAQDKVDESYHLYSLVGIQQGIPIKTNELIVSLSYFGLLQKYDSGLQLAVGFLF
jgi:hypothetical protein